LGRHRQKGATENVMADQFLTPQQVAEILQVTPRAVLDWLRSGYLAGYKLGRLWRVSQGQVNDLIARGFRDKGVLL
jgi:excisionase family DNA binding protein